MKNSLSLSLKFAALTQSIASQAFGEPISSQAFGEEVDRSVLSAQRANSKKMIWGLEFGVGPGGELQPRALARLCRVWG